MLLKGGSLLFNTLLFPLLRGPAMATVWLWSLMASASQDIPALSSDDPATRELATVDLLVNLAMLVSHFPAVRAPVRAVTPASIKDQAMRAPRHVSLHSSGPNRPRRAFWKDPSPCLANNPAGRWTSVSAALAVT